MKITKLAPELVGLVTTLLVIAVYSAFDRGKAIRDVAHSLEARGSAQETIWGTVRISLVDGDIDCEAYGIALGGSSALVDAQSCAIRIGDHIFDNGFGSTH